MREWSPGATISVEDRDLMIDILKAATTAKTLPCPVCGGEAIHAIEMLKKTMIYPSEDARDAAPEAYLLAERKHGNLEDEGLPPAKTHLGRLADRPKP